MKSYLFILSHAATLAGLFALELTQQNKYLINAFVLAKAWAALQATVFFASWLTFASKLPSPSTINWALEITKSEKHSLFHRFMGKVYLTQPFAIMIVAELTGQWFILICYAVFIGFMFRIRPAAVAYLKGMKIDLDKKNAVIDV